MPDSKFSFPIRQYLISKVKESFPTYANSVFEDLVVTPAALLYQDLLDRVNVLKRSLSITNYNTMLEEDMDALGNNYFVSRAVGNRSYGYIRIYLLERKPITITTDVVASYDSYTYSPVYTQTFVYENVLYDSVAGSYYIDVIFLATEAGSEYRRFAGDVITLSNFSLYSSAEVYSDFSIGSNSDTNADLYNKIVDSITNNELVKPAAIKKIIQETFPSVQNIKVIGYGDENMTRDMVDVMLPLEKVIPMSYCRKVNAPLNSSGVITWKDAFGNVITAPAGGFVGCIYDQTGVDFNALSVTWDGTHYRTVSAQPGYVVRILAPDSDAGDYVVSSVVTAQPSSTEAAVKMLMLDRRFLNASATPVTYKLIGSTLVDSFHVGGKVDLMIDSTSNEERVVTVSYAEGDKVIEIPLVTYVPETTLGDPMFLNNQPFVDPVLLILKVEQVAVSDTNRVDRTLASGVDYTVVRKEYREKFTDADYDVLRITTLDQDNINPFVNKPLKITYLTNPDFKLIQDYVDDEDNKTIDIQVQIPVYVLVDVKVTYSGTVTDAEDLIKDYINETGFGATLTASAINDLLFLAGATYVKHPIHFEATKYYASGDIETITSDDKLTLSNNEIFYPVTELSITNEA